MPALAQLRELMGDNLGDLVRVYLIDTPTQIALLESHARDGGAGTKAQELLEGLRASFAAAQPKLADVVGSERGALASTAHAVR